MPAASLVMILAGHIFVVEDGAAVNMNMYLVVVVEDFPHFCISLSSPDWYVFQLEIAI